MNGLNPSNYFLSFKRIVKIMLLHIEMPQNIQEQVLNKITCQYK